MNNSGKKYQQEIITTTKTEHAKNNEKPQQKACSLGNIVYDAHYRHCCNHYCFFFFLSSCFKGKPAEKKHTATTDDGMSDENDGTIRCVTWTWIRFFLLHTSHIWRWCVSLFPPLLLTFSRRATPIVNSQHFFSSFSFWNSVHFRQNTSMSFGWKMIAFYGRVRSRNRKKKLYSQLSAVRMMGFN